eukprot:GCRY01003588.1.p1 GENE.GCRY01003588.1~~GCRY01003588.1.p1  ORF type:complete len:136 (-),score=13.05 GCRY01003588.1:180-587(-)
MDSPNPIPKKDAQDTKRDLKKVAKDLGPPAQQVTVGTFLGYCAGFATRKAGKAGALGIGVAFVGLQALQYCGIIDVKWNQMQASVVRAADMNNDGRFDQDDVNLLKQKFFGLCQYNIPASSGFAGGFLLGMRRGR